MKRIVVPVAALAVTVAALAGCSKTDTTATTATSPAAQASSGDNKPTTTAGSDTGSTTKKGGTTSTKPTKDSSSPSITLPSDISIPGDSLDKTLGDAQKCLDMATGYAGMYTPLMSGGQVSDAEKAKIESALENMKANVPSNIADDINTIETGTKGANGYADLGKFLSSDTYTKANEEITTYLTTQCNKVGK